MSRDACPAYGKLCSACHRMNHFAICCNNKRQVETIQEQDTNSEGTESVEVVEVVNSASNKKKGIYTEMLIDETPIKFQIDSGATVNVIPKKYIQSAIQPERVELTLLSPSYFEVYQAQEFLYFSADCYEIWHRCETSHNLKGSAIKMSQGHHVGGAFPQTVTKN